MKFALLAAALAAIAAPVHAAETVISDPNSADWQVYGPTKPKVLKVETLPGGGAIRLPVTKGANPWDVGAFAILPGAIAESDTVAVGMYARTNTPAKESGVSQINAYVQQSEAPYADVMGGGIDLTDQWQFLCIVGKAKRAMDAGKASIRLHLAGAKQTIDLGPFMVVKLTGATAKTSLPCEKTITF